jgi:hypothetical protein
MLLGCVAALLASSAPGCASSPPVTELVVLVRSDLSVDDLHVTVTGPEGMLGVDEHVRTPAFPVSLVLTRDHAPYGPITVHVQGGDVASDAITEMVPGERRRLEIWLAGDCVCVPCPGGQTCRGGRCEDRHVDPMALPLWVTGSDASLAAPHDGGVTRDAGGDAGPPSTTCGCPGQPCCIDRCNGNFDCRGGTCFDCHPSMPDFEGSTTTGITSVTGIVGMGSSLVVSQQNGASVEQITIQLGGDVLASGTAMVGQVTGLSGSGSTLTVHGLAGASQDIAFDGATVSGAFIAPSMSDGSEGHLIRLAGAGPALAVTGWNGTGAMLTFTSVEVCR